MHWESLNEYMEQAFRAGYEKGYSNSNYDFTDLELDINITDAYVRYLEDNFPSGNREGMVA